jgi:hypothetical protein
MADINSDFDKEGRVLLLEKEIAALESAKRENLWKIHDYKRNIRNLENSLEVSEKALAAKTKELAELIQGG